MKLFLSCFFGNSLTKIDLLSCTNNMMERKDMDKRYQCSNSKQLVVNVRLFNAVRKRNI